jgi:hypothetical protein
MSRACYRPGQHRERPGRVSFLTEFDHTQPAQLGYLLVTSSRLAVLPFAVLTPSPSLPRGPCLAGDWDWPREMEGGGEYWIRGFRLETLASPLPAEEQAAML